MNDWTLKRNGFPGRPGPVLVVVLDGVGVAPAGEGNAVQLARKPTLDRIWTDCLTRQLKAHGKAVGLPSDKDMGNSEVGHNAIGAGRIYEQGAMLVNRALEQRTLFEGATWKGIVAQCLELRTPLHFIGLLSDGNVHSHIDQLAALLRECRAVGLPEVCVHPLLDGRDVPETSALKYIDALEELLATLDAQGGGGGRYRIASGGGRMLVTMDRYEANWAVVERGWRAHVLGQGRPFRSAREAILTYRAEDPSVTDQFTPEFVIVDGAGRPVGPIEDGHGVIFFNFRGDRAIEISRAFEEEEFRKFERQRWPRVRYAGMMQYDGDLLIPKAFLVEPPAIERTFGEYLARNGIPQFACSETQKFGHVTYFWNGNRSGLFDEQFETYQEVPSDRVPFEQRPWMKAAEITDATLAALATGRYRFARINYANGDMVGHTGDRQAAILAVEAVDLALGRLLATMERLGGITLVTADHGNADEMYELDEKTRRILLDAQGRQQPKTSHTLNPVPFTIVDPRFDGEYELDPTVGTGKLSNIAATALALLGYEAPAGFDRSLVRWR